MAVPFDVNRMAVSGNPIPVVPEVRHPGLITAADYSLARDGTLIYVPADVGAGGGLARVVWVDRAGRLLGSAVDTPLKDPRDLQMSPDGRRLLITTGLADISVYELEWPASHAAGERLNREQRRTHLVTRRRAGFLHGYAGTGLRASIRFPRMAALSRRSRCRSPTLNHSGTTSPVLTDAATDMAARWPPRDCGEPFDWWRRHHDAASRGRQGGGVDQD